MSEEAKTITIDGVEHAIADLSEEHRQVLGHVQVADQEIQRLNNLIAIVSNTIAVPKFPDILNK